MAKKVFVTGGSGFVGWNLTNFLLDQGYKVYTTYPSQIFKLNNTKSIYFRGNEIEP